ncbi:MAG: PadR family transcriptional regulator [Sedimentisphaerales bacterium]|nr:PadR family transcriptional regulator [Sedimentisphaerales bacterium]
MNAYFFENWTNQLRKGVLELCILNDIRARKSYGYDIVRTLARIKGLVIETGSIYNILGRFKREGLVRSSMNKSPDGPPRVCYTLTMQGEEMIIRMNSYWQAISTVTDSIKKPRRPKKR